MCPAEVREPLAQLLHRHTTTPDSCYFMIWEGYGGLAETFPEAPRIYTPGRSYLLFSGALDAVAEGIFEGPYRSCESPNAWWPSDRAWYVATEIDLCSTYVAGTRSCIDTLLKDSRLETLEARVSHDTTSRSDRINGPVPP